MTELVTCEATANVLPDGSVELMDMAGNVVMRIYDRPGNNLEKENEDLRALVIAQCECVKHDDCIECPHFDGRECTFKFKEMYQRLGIEVGA